MKRAIFSAVSIGIILIFSFAYAIHFPVQPGSIRLAGITAKLSTVNGTAFATQISGSLPVSRWLNRRITFSDGTNSASGFVKAVGTGETLGSELVDGWTNNATLPFETFTTSGADITSAINTTTYGIAYKDVTIVAGDLIKYVKTVTINSGGPLRHRFSTTITESVFQELDTSSGTAYKTAGANYGYITYSVGNGTAINFSISGHTTKKVTAPDTSGCTIVSTRGGATYNWAANSGINPNAASFTVTIGN